MSTRQPRRALDEAATAKTPQSVRAEGFTSVYANSAQLQMSAFDVKITFGEVASETTIEQKVFVILSLHHAKVFAQMLSDNLRNYEQQVGELKLPDLG